MDTINNSVLYKKEFNRETCLYKEFDPVLGVIELSRYKKVLDCRINRIDNIALPIEFEYSDGKLFGYYMKYIEGESLQDAIYNVPFDSIIKGVEELSNAYFELAKANVEVRSVELMDLMYSNGKLINIGIDGFREATSPNVRMVHMNSLVALKKPFLNILNSMNLPQEVKNRLSKDSNMLVTPVKMLENFKIAIETANSTELQTLSELRGKNGNKEKTFGNSGANWGW